MAPGRGRKKGRSEPDGELNVRGRTVEEARSDLDDFLEKAASQGWSRLKVIHGKGIQSPGGHSVVREAMTRDLERARQAGRIRDFRLGNLGEGGAGVTIVWL